MAKPNNEIDWRGMFVKSIDTTCGVRLVEATNQIAELHPDWFKAPERATSWITDPEPDAWFVTISHYCTAVVATMRISFSSGDHNCNAYITTYGANGSGNHDQTISEATGTIKSATTHTRDALRKIGDLYDTIREQLIDLRNTRQGKTRSEIATYMVAIETNKAQMYKRIEGFLLPLDVAEFNINMEEA